MVILVFMFNRIFAIALGATFVLPTTKKVYPQHFTEDIAVRLHGSALVN